MRRLILIAAMVAAASATQAADRSLRSPDGKATAAISAVGGGCEESRVTIRAGARAAGHAFASSDCQNGYVVDHAQWTADGRFFVFDMESSGGHQPLNHPLWRYDARDGSLREVALPQNVLPGGFRLRPPHDRLTLRTWDIDRQANGTLEVDLTTEK